MGEKKNCMRAKTSANQVLQFVGRDHLFADETEDQLRKNRDDQTHRQDVKRDSDENENDGSPDAISRGPKVQRETLSGKTENVNAASPPREIKAHPGRVDPRLNSRDDHFA